MRKFSSAASALLITGLLVAAPLSAPAVFADEVSVVAEPTDAVATVDVPVEQAPTVDAVVEEAPDAAAAADEASTAAAPAESAPTESATVPVASAPTPVTVPTSSAPLMSAAVAEYQGVPGAPTGVTVTGQRLPSGQWTLRIKWNPSNPTTADTTYSVYATDHLNTVTAAGLTTTQYDFTTASPVPPGSHLDVQITARNSFGSIASQWVSPYYAAFQPTVVSAPGAPTNLTATRSATMDSLTLNWNAPADTGNAPLTAYIVVISANGIGTETAGATAPGVTSLTIDKRKVGTTYTYSVTASNSQFTGTPATLTAAFTAVAPTAPNGLEGTSYSPREASLSWDAPTYDGGSEVTNYKVVVDTNPGSVTLYTDDWFPSVELNVDPHVNSYIDAVVYASNDNGATFGAASVSGRVEFGTFAPDAPVITASAQNYFDHSVLVEWDTPAPNGSEITGYDVYLSTGGRTFSRDSADAGATSLLLSGLSAETTYSATVVAKNEVGASTISNSATATTLAGAPAALPSESIGEAGSMSVVAEGDYVIATLADVKPGSWVYGYAYSSPQGLGWAQVGDGGVVFWNIAAAQLALGQHHLAVMDEFGALIGSTAFTLSAPPTSVVPLAPLPISPAAVVPSATAVVPISSAALASTGADSAPVAVTAFGLLVLGVILTLRRRIGRAA